MTCTATFSATLSDDGGVEHAGEDTSPPVPFTLTVYYANTPPSFALAGHVTVLENSGALSAPGFAGNISTGAVDEAYQTLTFTVELLEGGAAGGLFLELPALSPDGDLTFALRENVFGAARLAVTDPGPLSCEYDTYQPVKASFWPEP